MRVLVVEDEPKIAGLIRRGLDAAGFVVDIAPTGEDALWMARSIPYEAIAARPRALVRRGASERPAVLDVGSLRLDPAARRVWRGTTELQLSAKELALLEAFTRHPARARNDPKLSIHYGHYLSQVTRMPLANPPQRGARTVESSRPRRRLRRQPRDLPAVRRLPAGAASRGRDVERLGSQAADRDRPE